MEAGSPTSGRHCTPRIADWEDDFFACLQCGYCAPVCPPFQEMGWESITPRGKMYYLRSHYMKGPLDRLLRRKTRIDASFAEAAYRCTSCGHCQVVCPVDIPFSRTWDEIKEWTLDRGVANYPEHQEQVANVVQERNIYGELHAQRAAWLPEDAQLSDRPEVIYWAGCAASYRQQELARAVVKILNAAGVRYNILGQEEWCSGGPLMRMGYVRYVVRELGPHNIEAVAKTGVRALVTACAECYRAFWRDYREKGVGNPPFSVYHISQYVERLVKDKRLKLNKTWEEAVTLHDACQMGRNAGNYEAPRTAIKFVSKAKFTEMRRTRDDTLCSGAAGGFNLVWKREARNIARRRLEEARATGSDVLATTCPHAEAHMKDVARRANIPIRVLDLAELIAESMEPPASPQPEAAEPVEEATPA